MIHTDTFSDNDTETAKQRRDDKKKREASKKKQEAAEHAAQLEREHKRQQKNTSAKQAPAALPGMFESDISAMLITVLC